MAITNGYCTQNELKAFVGIPSDDSGDDNLLDDAINAASRQIDAFCGRYFYLTDQHRQENFLQMIYIDLKLMIYLQLQDL